MTELAIRPAVPGDAEEICRLLNAVDLIEIGREETDLAAVKDDLTHPEAALAENSWLAHRDGELVGYGLMWDDSGADRIDMDQYVLPDHQDAAERLFELMEPRALDRARANGADRAVIHLHLNTRPTVDPALLTRRGWNVVRTYHVMTRPLHPAGDVVPPPPHGLTLRDCREETDRIRARELLNETFAEHFDHQPRSYAQWKADLGGGIDWSRVWIATLAGEGDVAVMVTRNDREAHAWIANLGVVTRMRGRGIAGYLLRYAYAVYAALGREAIGLGVDTANASGAPRLYAAHGMTPYFAAHTWELTLPTP
ncbi:GNAT family N-acetyltransferase [Streptomyces sp. NPDC057638]|uniref:GNAT family N-acetyltransferase n=1 Tax=Streptomyces sp. NPDC057638 TaxID=3346190 RepID=UPI003687D6F4